MKEVINKGHIVKIQNFMEGKLPNLPGEFPTLNDWENSFDRNISRGLFLAYTIPIFWIFLFLDVTA